MAVGGVAGVDGRFCCPFVGVWDTYVSWWPRFLAFFSLIVHGQHLYTHVREYRYCFVCRCSCKIDKLIVVETFPGHYVLIYLSRTQKLSLHSIFWCEFCVDEMFVKHFSSICTSGWYVTSLDWFGDRVQKVHGLVSATRLGPLLVSLSWHKLRVPTFYFCFLKLVSSAQPFLTNLI